jgi:hypothetical protein
MDRLPSELVDHLFGFLCTESSKNLRLSCKSFAEIGESHLFNNFEFRLYPQLFRLSQLKQLSRHPTIAPKLRCLCYESGIQLEYGVHGDWLTWLYCSEMELTPMLFSSEGQGQRTIQRFHDLLKGGISADHYEQYECWLDHQAEIMAHTPEVAATFASTLNKCCSLNSIKIVMARPNITVDDLVAHVSRSHEYIATYDVPTAIRIERRKRNCLAHFMSLLKAVDSSARSVSDLVAINLPEAMLKGTKYEADIIARVFSPLHHLDLKIDDFPQSNPRPRYSHIRYFRGLDVPAMTLRKLLNEPKELRRLSLTFPLDRVTNFSGDLFDQKNLDQHPWKWLPGLKQLSLSNFVAQLPALVGLLDEARDLKSLALRQVDLGNGSMMKLLTYLRDLKLDDVLIGGEWLVKEDRGDWHCHGGAHGYICCGYEGRYAVNALWSKIESYIIHGGPCPLPEWSPDEDPSKTWEFEGDSSWHYMPRQRGSWSI